MPHRATYRIDSYPGCEGAALQATGNSDRPLCSFVSALASEDRSPLLGTLAGATGDVLAEWFESECARYQVTPARVCAWAAAINGKLSGFESTQPTYEVPDRGKIVPLALDLYQINALKAMTCAGGALGLFMGAGKTLCGTAYATEWAKPRVGPRRCWIIGPLNSFPAWEGCLGELNRHFDEVRIFSMDSVHKFVGAANIGGVLLVDESHGFGSATARRTGAIHAIRSKFDVCLELTGTLTHAGIESTLSFADLAVPGMALFSTRWKAGAHFECLVRKSIGPRTVAVLEKPTAKRQAFNAWLGRWAYLLKPRSPEVRAAFILPEQHVHDIRLGEPWPSFDTEVAEAALAAMAEDPDGKIPPAAKIRHLLARAHAAEKIEFLLAELASDPELPTVGFAAYTETLDILEFAFKEAGLTYVRVDGEVTGAERAEAERKFQSGEIQHFIGQQKAASISMNLQRAQFSYTIDINGSPIDYPQALARTCRRGQAHECVHLDLAANRTQAAILAVVRRGEAFDSACAEYQEMHRILKGVVPCPTPSTTGKPGTSTRGRVEPLARAAPSHRPSQPAR